MTDSIDDARALAVALRENGHDWEAVTIEEALDDLLGTAVQGHVTHFTWQQPSGPAVVGGWLCADCGTVRSDRSLILDHAVQVHSAVHVTITLGTRG